jgi:1-phosphofructokinase/tagatose 6-phosphate kinase
MFLTVTLNAAIDKTLRVANLQIGRRHRCAPGDLQAGGKGINVARALRALGQPVVATGLAGGRAGDMIIEDLTSGGIVHQFVRILDESRSSTIVLDAAGTHMATEVVEYGPIVRTDELEAFASAYSYLLGGTDAVVLAGSLPREVPEDWYSTALREARRQRVFTVLDSEGEPLRLGLSGEPDLVVPNQMEAEELVGFEFEATQDHVLALEQIVEMGARGVVITRDDGALALVRESGKPLFLRATIPLLEVVSPVGAGDALLAGLLASRRAQRPFATPWHAVPQAPSTSSRACSIPARCSDSPPSSRSPRSRPPRPEGLPARHRGRAAPTPLLASGDVGHSTSRRALLPRPRPLPRAPLGLVVEGQNSGGIRHGGDRDRAGKEGATRLRLR